MKRFDLHELVTWPSWYLIEYGATNLGHHFAAMVTIWHDGTWLLLPTTLSSLFKMWVLFISSEVTFRKFRSENFLHESCSSARRLKPVKFWEFSEFFWCLKMGLQLLYSSMAGEFLQILFLHVFLISDTWMIALASQIFFKIMLFITYPKLKIIQPL